MLESYFRQRSGFNNLVEYDDINKKSKCSCLIKISLPFLEDIRFDKNKLYNNFKNIKNIANIKILKCYKDVFDFNNIKKNYAFFIHACLYVLFFICLILFCFKYYFLLKEKIIKLTEEKNNSLKLKIHKTKNTDKENQIITRNEEQNNNKNFNNKRKKSEIKAIEIDRPISKEIPYNKKKSNLKRKKIKRIKIKTKSNISNAKIKIIKSNDNLGNFSKKNENKNEKNLGFNDMELNSLLYEKALIYDKRTYIQYYISLLRKKHLLLFSFYITDKDYNSQIIKMFLFFLFFSVNFAINALFFNDNTMYKIYIDEGEFNLIYQIPQIIYSTIISSVTGSLIKYLALTEKIILTIKEVKNLDDLNSKKEKVSKTVKMKFTLFFIIGFIILFIFMIYSTCFCGIYVNTQIHLIKDSIISYGLSLIYPFCYNLIPGIFRISALRAEKKDKKYLFRFSKFIQNKRKIVFLLLFKFLRILK